MKRFRLFIGTTDGPAEVQRVTPEDREVRSVICLDGKAISLPISDDYDAFVRRPTGVVEALLGHPAYRIDISQPIVGGYSWQLGVLVAHILADAGRLDGPEGPARMALWLTGEVDHNFNIGAVDDVALKLTRAATTFKILMDGGIEPVIIVPEACLDQAKEALAASFPGGDGTPRVIGVKLFDDVLCAIGAKRPKRKWTKRRVTLKPRRASLRGLALGLATAAAVVVAAAGWTSDSGDRPTPAATPVAVAVAVAAPVPATGIAPSLAMHTDARPHQLGLIETRAPQHADCAAVNFAGAEAVVIRHSMSASGPPAATIIVPDGLCDLRYRVTHPGLGTLTIAAIAARHDGSGRQFRTKALVKTRELAAGSTFDLDARPPRHMAALLVQRLVLLARPGGPGTAGDAPLERAAAALSAVTTPENWDQTIARIRAQGLFVISARQDFPPSAPGNQKTGQTLP